MNAGKKKIILIFHNIVCHGNDSVPLIRAKVLGPPVHPFTRPRQPPPDRRHDEGHDGRSGAA